MGALGQCADSSSYGLSLPEGFPMALSTEALIALCYGHVCFSGWLLQARHMLCLRALALAFPSA